MVAFEPPMLNQEQAVQIKILARQGLSIRQIAHECELSRQTVRKYLKEPSLNPPDYGPRAARPTKLDPFKPYLLDRIGQAKPQWLMASVLCREIRALGYDGGDSVVRQWVSSYKPIAKADPVVRFETEPGEQMQADFTIVRRGAKPLMALVATLGYSRATFVRFTDKEDTDALVDCLRQALEYFGGVPRHVLFDNAKSVIITRHHYGVDQHLWNAQLLEFSVQYGFTLRVCKPYRARTKGKVERFNRYLKTSFVLPLQVTLRQSGLQLDSLLANASIGAWLNDIANVRIHGTTGLVPMAQLVIERAHLGALPTDLVKPAQVNTNSAPSLRTVPPVTQFQHDLAIYDQLLEVL
jgi:transposase